MNCMATRVFPTDEFEATKGIPDHTQCISFAETALLKLLKTNSIDTYLMQHPDTIYATDCKNSINTPMTLGEGTESNSRPDLYFESEDMIVIGEAKATEGDARAKHTIEQMNNYVKFLVKATQAHKIMLVSAPYVYVSIIENSFLVALNQQLKNREYNQQELQILENSIRRFHGEKTDEEKTICCVTATEIENAFIKPPEHWRDNVEASNRFASLTEAGSDPYAAKMYSYVKSIDKTIPYYIGYMSTSDLVFDDMNNRLLGSESISLEQNECQAKLLHEGGVEWNRRRDAVQRRRELINLRMIETAFEVWETTGVNGGSVFVVVDGNSRLAHCRYIMKHAASAESYSIVPVRVYREIDGVDIDDINARKAQVQNSTVLKHGLFHDALGIYRSINNEGLSLDEVQELFNGQYSHELVRDSMETIKLMKKSLPSSVSDEDMERMYQSVYAVVSRVPDQSPNAKSPKSFLDKKKIVRRLYLELGNDNDRETFLNRKTFEKTIVSVMRRKTRPQAAVALLEDWLENKEDCNTPEKFSAKLEIIDAANRKSSNHRENLIKSCDRIEKQLYKVARTLELLAESDKEELKNMGYSYTSLEEIVNIKNRLNQAASEVAFYGTRVDPNKFDKPKNKKHKQEELY